MDNAKTHAALSALDEGQQDVFPGARGVGPFLLEVATLFPERLETVCDQMEQSGVTLEDLGGGLRMALVLAVMGGHAAAVHPLASFLPQAQTDQISCILMDGKKNGGRTPFMAHDGVDALGVWLSPPIMEKWRDFFTGDMPLTEQGLLELVLPDSVTVPPPSPRL
jgi:hypothetical protein